MKLRTWMPTALAAVLLSLTACTSGPERSSRSQPSDSAEASEAAAGAVEAVSPGLGKYQDQAVLTLWDRDGLTRRDRSLVTFAGMVSAHQTDGLTFWAGKALDDGVTPAELSEALIQLAFYSGWQNAVDAAPAVQAAFDQRGVEAAALPAAEATPTPLEGAALEAERTRAAQVESQWGSLFPGVTDSTNRVLFGDVWRRPGLAPRDRSLVTVVALITTSQPNQVTYHLDRGMDNGLTGVEVGETLNQLAYFAGWPKVFTALPVVKDVLESR